VQNHKGSLITHNKTHESCREKFKENRILRATSMYVLFINKLFSLFVNKINCINFTSKFDDV